MSGKKKKQQASLFIRQSWLNEPPMKRVGKTGTNIQPPYRALHWKNKAGLLQICLGFDNRQVSRIQIGVKINSKMWGMSVRGRRSLSSFRVTSVLRSLQRCDVISQTHTHTKAVLWCAVFLKLAVILQRSPGQLGLSCLCRLPLQGAQCQNTERGCLTCIRCVR